MDDEGSVIIEINADVSKMYVEMEERSFAVVNPKNTYEYISVVKMSDIIDIISKYTEVK